MYNWRTAIRRWYPSTRKYIWSLSDLDLENLFSSSCSHDIYCSLFHVNPSTKYRGIGARRISVNGRRAVRLENIMPLAACCRRRDTITVLIIAGPVMGILSCGMQKFAKLLLVHHSVVKDTSQACRTCTVHLRIQTVTFIWKKATTTVDGRCIIISCITHKWPGVNLHV